MSNGSECLHTTNQRLCILYINLVGMVERAIVVVRVHYFTPIYILHHIEESKSTFLKRTPLPEEDINVVGDLVPHLGAIVGEPAR